MTIRISPKGRVVCFATIELPLSAVTAWGQLRNFRDSARHDPFHAKIDIDGDVPRVGAALQIEHRYFLWQTTRIGKILRWQEGHGFAFSDLCKADTRRAFPHVLSYQLLEKSDHSCQLEIRVGGRWTSPLPHWLARLWLWWVFGFVVHTVRNELLQFALMRMRTQENRRR